MTHPKAISHIRLVTRKPGPTISKERESGPPSEVRTEIVPEELVKVRSQLEYERSGTGEVLNVKPGGIPSESRKRGREFAFDLRLNAESQNRKAVQRIAGFQKRLEKIVTAAELFILPKDAFHIALGGFYPGESWDLDSNGPIDLPEDAVENALTLFQQKLNTAFKDSPELIIAIIGARMTNNGTVVLDLKEHHGGKLAGLRGLAYSAMEEANWPPGKFRINRSKDGQVSDSGIVTLARVIPHPDKDEPLSSSETLMRVEGKITKMDRELKNSPITLRFTQEDQEIARLGTRVLIEEIEGWASTNDFLKERADEIVKLTANGFAHETYEAVRQIEAMDWGRRKGIYSPQQVQKDLQGEPPGSLLMLKRQRHNQILATHGERVALLELELRHLSVLTLSLALKGIPMDVARSSHYYYLLLEIERFKNSNGIEGLNPEFISPAQQILVLNEIAKSQLRGAREQLGRQIAEHLDTISFRSSAERLLPEIEKIIASWEERYVRTKLEHAVLQVIGPLRLTRAAGKKVKDEISRRKVEIVAHVVRQLTPDVLSGRRITTNKIRDALRSSGLSFDRVNRLNRPVRSGITKKVDEIEFNIEESTHRLKFRSAFQNPRSEARWLIMAAKIVLMVAVFGALGYWALRDTKDDWAKEFSQMTELIKETTSTDVLIDIVRDTQNNSIHRWYAVRRLVEAATVNESLRKEVVPVLMEEITRYLKKELDPQTMVASWGVEVEAIDGLAKFKATRAINLLRQVYTDGSVDQTVREAARGAVEQLEETRSGRSRVQEGQLDREEKLKTSGPRSSRSEIRSEIVTPKTKLEERGTLIFRRIRYEIEQIIHVAGDDFILLRAKKKYAGQKRQRRVDRPIHISRSKSEVTSGPLLRVSLNDGNWSYISPKRAEVRSPQQKKKIKYPAIHIPLGTYLRVYSGIFLPAIFFILNVLTVVKLGAQLAGAKILNGLPWDAVITAYGIILVPAIIHFAMEKSVWLRKRQRAREDRRKAAGMRGESRSQSVEGRERANGDIGEPKQSAVRDSADRAELRAEWKGKSIFEIGFEASLIPREFNLLVDAAVKGFSNLNEAERNQVKKVLRKIFEKLGLLETEKQEERRRFLSQISALMIKLKARGKLDKLKSTFQKKYLDETSFKLEREVKVSGLQTGDQVQEAAAEISDEEPLGALRKLLAKKPRGIEEAYALSISRGASLEEVRRTLKEAGYEMTQWRRDGLLGLFRFKRNVWLKVQEPRRAEVRHELVQSVEFGVRSRRERDDSIIPYSALSIPHSETRAEMRGQLEEDWKIARSAVWFFLRRGVYFKQDIEDAFQDIHLAFAEERQKGKPLSELELRKIALAALSKHVRDYHKYKRVVRGFQAAYRSLVTKRRGPRPMLDDVDLLIPEVGEETFGDRLRSHFRRRGWSQRRGARELGFSYGSIKPWISGKIPSPFFVKRLATALDTTVSELMIGIPREELLAIRIEDEESGEYRKILGLKVKVLRYEKGWTKSRLAREVGIKDNTIIRLEAGEPTFPYRYIGKLAENLGTTIGDLTGGMPYEKIMAIRVFDEKSEEHRELFGLKLRVLRYRRRLSQTGFQGQSSTSAWESGKWFPYPRSMKIIARNLKTTVSELLAGIPEEKLMSMRVRDEKSREAKQILGLKIKIFRYKRGWTLTELAQEMHVHVDTASDWEAGLHFPAIRHFKQLAERLNSTVSHLLVGLPAEEIKTRLKNGNDPDYADLFNLMIRVVRYENGWSSGKLGAEVGIPRVTIDGWSWSRAVPAPNNWKKLTTGKGHVLFGDYLPPSRPKPTELDETERKVHELYQQLGRYSSVARAMGWQGAAGGVRARHIYLRSLRKLGAQSRAEVRNELVRNAEFGVRSGRQLEDLIIPHSALPILYSEPRPELRMGLEEIAIYEEDVDLEAYQRVMRSAEVRFLTREEEKILFRALHARNLKGEERRTLFDFLVLKYLPRIKRVIRKLVRGEGRDKDNMYQDGSLGLMEAVCRFDYRLGTRFGTFADWWIWGKILIGLNDLATGKLPSQERELVPAILSSQQELTQLFKREPTMEELAKALGEEEKTVIRILSFFSRAKSLDAPAGNGELNRYQFRSDPKAETPEAIAVREEEHREIVPEISRRLALLSSYQQLVIKLRFGIGTQKEGGYTLDEIGTMLGVTRENIRQIEDRAIKNMRSNTISDAKTRPVSTEHGDVYLVEVVGIKPDHPVFEDMRLKPLIEIKELYERGFFANFIPAQNLTMGRVRNVKPRVGYRRRVAATARAAAHRAEARSGSVREYATWDHFHSLIHVLAIDSEEKNRLEAYKRLRELALFQPFHFGLALVRHVGGEIASYAKSILLEVAWENPEIMTGPIVSSLEDPSRNPHAEELLGQWIDLIIKKKDRNKLSIVARPLIGILALEIARPAAERLIQKIALFDLGVIVNRFMGALKDPARRAIVGHLLVVISRYSAGAAKFVTETVIENLYDNEIAEYLIEVLLEISKDAGEKTVKHILWLLMDVLHFEDYLKRVRFVPFKERLRENKGDFRRNAAAVLSRMLVTYPVETVHIVVGHALNHDVRQYADEILAEIEDKQPQILTDSYVAAQGRMSPNEFVESELIRLAASHRGPILNSLIKSLKRQSKAPALVSLLIKMARSNSELSGFIQERLKSAMSEVPTHRNLDRFGQQILAQIQSRNEVRLGLNLAKERKVLLSGNASRAEVIQNDENGHSPILRNDDRTADARLDVNKVVASLTHTPKTGQFEDSTKVLIRNRSDAAHGAGDDLESDFAMLGSNKRRRSPFGSSRISGNETFFLKNVLERSHSGTFLKEQPNRFHKPAPRIVHRISAAGNGQFWADTDKRRPLSKNQGSEFNLSHGIQTITQNRDAVKQPSYRSAVREKFRGEAREEREEKKRLPLTASLSPLTTHLSPDSSRPAARKRVRSGHELEDSIIPHSRLPNPHSETPADARDLVVAHDELPVTKGRRPWQYERADLRHRARSRGVSAFRGGGPANRERQFRELLQAGSQQETQHSLLLHPFLFPLVRIDPENEGKSNKINYNPGHQKKQDRSDLLGASDFIQLSSRGQHPKNGLKQYDASVITRKRRGNDEVISDARLLRHPLGLLPRNDGQDAIASSTPGPLPRDNVGIAASSGIRAAVQSGQELEDLIIPHSALPIPHLETRPEVRSGDKSRGDASAPPDRVKQWEENIGAVKRMLSKFFQEGNDLNYALLLFGNILVNDPVRIDYMEKLMNALKKQKGPRRDKNARHGVELTPDDLRDLLDWVIGDVAYLSSPPNRKDDGPVMWMWVPYRDLPEELITEIVKYRTPKKNFDDAADAWRAYQAQGDKKLIGFKSFYDKHFKKRGAMASGDQAFDSYSFHFLPTRKHDDLKLGIDTDWAGRGLGRGLVAFRDVPRGRKLVVNRLRQSEQVYGMSQHLFYIELEHVKNRLIVHTHQHGGSRTSQLRTSDRELYDYLKHVPDKAFALLIDRLDEVLAALGWSAADQIQDFEIVSASKVAYEWSTVSASTVMTAYMDFPQRLGFHMVERKPNEIRNAPGDQAMWRESVWYWSRPLADMKKPPKVQIETPSSFRPEVRILETRAEVRETKVRSTKLEAGAQKSLASGLAFHAGGKAASRSEMRINPRSTEELREQLMTLVREIVILLDLLTVDPRRENRKELETEITELRRQLSEQKEFVNEDQHQIFDKLVGEVKSLIDLVSASKLPLSTQLIREHTQRIYSNIQELEFKPTGEQKDAISAETERFELAKLIRAKDVEGIADMLSRSDEVPIKVDAIRALGLLKASQYADLIVPYLTFFTPPFGEGVRLTAITALRNLNAKQYLTEIAKKFTDPTLSVRSRAAGVIGAFGDPTYIPQLKELLNDKSAAVRLAAAKALQKFGVDIPEEYRSEARSNDDVFMRIAASLPEEWREKIQAVQTKPANRDVFPSWIQALNEAEATRLHSILTDRVPVDVIESFFLNSPHFLASDPDQRHQVAVSIAETLEDVRRLLRSWIEELDRDPHARRPAAIPARQMTTPAETRGVRPQEEREEWVSEEEAARRARFIEWARDEMGIEATNYDELVRAMTERFSYVVHVNAASIARTLPPRTSWNDFEDLEIAGVLGLIDALGKYDPARGVQFDSYAKHRVRGAILDELRKIDPEKREVRELANALQEEGRTRSTSEEVVGSYDVTRAAVLRALQVARGGDISLDKKLFETDTGKSVTIKDRLLSNSPTGDFVAEQRDLIEYVMRPLSPREKAILILYYHGNLPMKQVGEILGVSESRISQILKDLPKRIKERMHEFFERGTLMRLDTFAARSRYARLATGLRRRDVTQQLYRNVEKGLMRPREETFVKLADAYGVSIQWLKTGHNIPPFLSPEHLEVGAKAIVAIEEERIRMALPIGILAHEAKVSRRAYLFYVAGKVIPTSDVLSRLRSALETAKPGGKYPTRESVLEGLAAREAKKWPSHVRALQIGEHKDAALLYAARKFGIELPRPPRTGEHPKAEKSRSKDSKKPRSETRVIPTFSSLPEAEPQSAVETENRLIVTLGELRISGELRAKLKEAIQVNQANPTFILVIVDTEFRHELLAERELFGLFGRDFFIRYPVELHGRESLKISTEMSPWVVLNRAIGAARKEVGLNGSFFSPQVIASGSHDVLSRLGRRDTPLLVAEPLLFDLARRLFDLKDAQAWFRQAAGPEGILHPWAEHLRTLMLTRQAQVAAA